MKCMLCSALVCKGEESPCTPEGHTGSNQTKVQPGDVQAGNRLSMYLCVGLHRTDVGNSGQGLEKSRQAAAGAKSQEVEIWECYMAL